MHPALTVLPASLIPADTRGQDDHQMQALAQYDDQLAYCTVCGGFEGTLTTHCAGSAANNELVHAMIYCDGWDFRSGHWVRPHYYERGEENHWSLLSGHYVKTVYRKMRGHIPQVVK